MVRNITHFEVLKTSKKELNDWDHKEVNSPDYTFPLKGIDLLHLGNNPKRHGDLSRGGMIGSRPGLYRYDIDQHQIENLDIKYIDIEVEQDILLQPYFVVCSIRVSQLYRVRINITSGHKFRQTSGFDGGLDIEFDNFLFCVFFFAIGCRTNKPIFLDMALQEDNRGDDTAEEMRPTISEEEKSGGGSDKNPLPP
ncbi:hypothetical protein COLO4_12136 [Corchorus olitorius]|uniref:Uncharacterized protein n=1 Tax=Corchorus olitorius TaxID=93759 RepID=A0A1R3K231_9ROSI|nr:hypothetical protein COLO4_12136 [Corchorus olitorius]